MADEIIDLEIRLNIESGFLDNLQKAVKDAEDAVAAWADRQSRISQKIQQISLDIKSATTNYKNLKEEFSRGGLLPERFFTPEQQQQLKQMKEEIRSLNNERIALGQEKITVAENLVEAKKELKEVTKEYKEQLSVVKKINGQIQENNRESEKIAEKEKNYVQDIDEAREMAYQEEMERNRERKSEEEKSFREELSRQTKRKEMFERISQVSRMVAVASTAAMTGLVAMASRWANKMEQEGTRTDISRRWINAMKDMEKSSMRIGAVLAEKLVPYLEKAADYLDKIASWMEQNPEIVEAGVKGLAIITVVSTIISAIFKVVATLEGLSLSLQKGGILQGATKVGEAVKGFGASFVNPATMTAAITTSAIMIAGGVVASAAIIVMIDKILKQYGVDKKIESARDVARESNARINPFLINDPRERQLQVQLNRAIQKGDAQEIERLKNEIAKLGETSKNTSIEVAKTEAELKQIAETTKTFTSIMDNLYLQDREAERQYKEAVTGIVKGSNQRLLEIERQGRAAITQLAIQNKKAEKAEINALNKDLARLDADYRRQSADIIRRSGEEIVQINKDTQEQLRKLEEEHNVRVEEFTRSRDALGLAKERRDYEKQRGEIRKDANERIAEVKKESARALEELKRSHAEQRAERIRAYQEQAAERKQAVAEQMAEIYKRIQEEKAATIAQRNEMLSQLMRQFNEERRARYLAAGQQLSDLNMSMVNERILRNKYYRDMLADVTAFSNAYRRSLPSSLTLSGGSVKTGAGTKTTTTSTKTSTSGFQQWWSYWYPENRATGGYLMNERLYRVAENDKKEFVLSNQTTNAAEKIIGSQLTQGKILMALTGGGSNQSNVTWNDNRTFSGEVPKNVRDQIRNETLEDVARILRNIRGSRGAR